MRKYEQLASEGKFGLAAAVVALVALIGGRIFWLAISRSIVTTIVDLVLLVLGTLGIAGLYLASRDNKAKRKQQDTETSIPKGPKI